MLKIGETLDRKYRIVGLIGAGGMGAVYEAEHVFLQRRVAIKVLASEYSHDAEAVKRFYREAQAAARIGHENICEVIDISQSSNNLPYLVMEFLLGLPLSKVMESVGRFPVGRAIDIVTQVLDALEAAHKAGIVHRDVKPDNIFLTVFAQKLDFVKLVDFGISKIRTPGLGKGSTLTQAGTVLGTPLYMSPEQARGDMEVDGRADIWATGVVLYQMLTGCNPFDGENYNRILFNVLSAPIPTVRALRPEIGRALNAAVLRALDRDVARRFPDCASFREALLEGWLAEEEQGGAAERKPSTRVPAVARAAGDRAPEAAASFDLEPLFAPTGSLAPEDAPPPAGAAAEAPAAPGPLATLGTPRGAVVPTTTHLPPFPLWRHPVVLAASAGLLLVVAALAYVFGLRGTPEPRAGEVVAAAPLGAKPPGPPTGGPTTAAVPAAASTTADDAGTTPPAATHAAETPDGGMPETAAKTNPNPIRIETADAAGAGMPSVSAMTDAGASAPDARAAASGAARPRTPAAPRDTGPVSAPPSSTSGTLTVVTSPPTRVFLDGRFLADTPFFDREIEAGRYRIRFVNEAQGVAREEMVVIVAGRETTVRRGPAQLGIASPTPAPATGIADAGARPSIRIRTRDGGTSP
ncbi:MAG: serine/threonine protein kinase [Myxococcales bacterium]|nr:serine/threonine protein kinase [Myxococcales bacterium]